MLIVVAGFNFFHIILLLHCVRILSVLYFIYVYSSSPGPDRGEYCCTVCTAARYIIMYAHVWCTDYI